MFQKFSEKYLAEFVYGAIDGTVTTFAIISAVSGAALSPAVVLVLGFSNVLADGFSMAASNYLSEKSDTALNGAGDKETPLKTAGVTFASFVLVGSIPILPFALLYNNPSVNPFTVSIAATIAAFLIIGYVRGRVTKENKIVAALETLLIGAVAAAIAYGVGSWLEGLI